MIAGAIVCAAAIATFARGVPGPLVASWDDGRFLIENRDVQEPSWSALIAILREPRFEAYHPLHLLSYWIDVPWAGTSGPVIHAVSLALWCAALIVVLALMRRLGLGLGAAVIATLALGLHPVQVEAVTWATGRKEILALGLAAGAALAHLHAERAGDRAAWLSRVLYVLAALAKTTVLPLPLVLLAADVILRGRRWKHALAIQAPSLAIGAALGVVVIRIWSGHQMIRAGDEAAAEGADAWLVPATVAHHVATALWPAATSPVYPLARDAAPSAALAIAGCAAVAVAIALAWRARRRELGRRVLFGLVAFVVLLAPVSNVVPLFWQWQDRYLSLPLFGLAFALGALVDAAIAARRDARLPIAVGGAIVIALAARTAQYEGAWRSEAALWGHAASTQPRAFYAWLKLGEVRRDAGEIEGALRAYERAIEVAPRLRLGHAAFLSALALRDERRHDLAPSRAIAIAQRFMERIEEPLALRELAGELAEDGYRDATTYVLARALDVEPIPEERLERAAAIQLAQGNEWLARFYVGRLTREPVLPEIRAYVARERARRAERSATGDGAASEPPRAREPSPERPRSITPP